MKKALFGILCVLIVAACHDVRKQKQLDQLSTLNTIVVNIQQQVDSIDIVAWNQTRASTQETRRIIKANYTTDDTISLEFAQKLENYKAIEVNLSYFEKEREQFLEALQRARNAVKLLRNDVENSQGDRNAYDKNIAIEKKRVTELANYFAQWLETKTKCVNSYHDLHPTILEFTKSL